MLDIRVPAHFRAWMDSQDFAKGHGTGQADGNTDAEGEQARKPEFGHVHINGGSEL